LRDRIFYFLRSLADLPEKPPFGIRNRRLNRTWFVLLVKRVNESLVITRFLNTFGSGTRLPTELWTEVFDLFSSIISFADGVEVSLHHIDIVFVGFLVNAGVLELDDAPLVERIGYLGALFFPSFSLVHVDLSINNGNFFKRE